MVRFSSPTSSMPSSSARYCDLYRSLRCLASVRISLFCLDLVLDPVCIVVNLGFNCLILDVRVFLPLITFEHKRLPFDLPEAMEEFVAGNDAEMNTDIDPQEAQQALEIAEANLSRAQY
ncbi:uncharacterized protein A4U43_C04F9370 [Asparagus officinalis]|uniref:Uncharacterized protein n=1 Tax=Asparagus officinalis TaxID=4686 RepID=A0A5P1EZH2_ASPOF|nr:uncharacterized protein A4U43_C04F9370 [Asparagus officinalis]